MNISLFQNVFKMSWKTRCCYIDDVFKTPSRRFGVQQMFAYIFVKHIIFSKVVNRLKACNFASKEIAKKFNIKLSEILEGAIL